MRHREAKKSVKGKGEQTGKEAEVAQEREARGSKAERHKGEKTF